MSAVKAPEKPKVELTLKQEKILELWVSLAMIGKTVDQIKLMSTEDIVRDGFNTYLGFVRKFRKNKEFQDAVVKACMYQVLESLGESLDDDILPTDNDKKALGQSLE